MSKDSLNSISLIFSSWGFTWSGLLNNRRGEWWLIAQLLIIIGHILPASILVKIILPNYLMIGLGILLFTIGVILAISSLISLGDNISPLPDPKYGAELVKNRAYKNCRHPLYQSILICSFSLFILLNSLIHLILFVSLCFVLKGKALREEKMLLKKYPEYNYYIKNTAAIFPWLPFFDWRS